MKTLRKYATMAFLLISATAIIPAYANPTLNDQEKVQQEEIIVESKNTKTVWYKRPEMREKIYMAFNIGSFAAASVAVYLLMLKAEARCADPIYQYKKYGIKLMTDQDYETYAIIPSSTNGILKLRKINK